MKIREVHGRVKIISGEGLIVLSPVRPILRGLRLITFLRQESKLIQYDFILQNFKKQKILTQKCHVTDEFKMHYFLKGSREKGCEVKMNTYQKIVVLLMVTTGTLNTVSAG